MEPVEVGEHLIVHPGICHGQLTFKGTRVPVETVLYFLSTGRTIEQILEGWPELKREAVAEAILLAADALVERYTRRVKATNGKPEEATDLAALAAPRHVGPVKNFEGLQGDFWSEQESGEPILYVVHNWRRKRKGKRS